MVHVPQHQRHLGKGPSSHQPHKMPGSCEEGKVFLCSTQRKARSSTPELSNQGCQPGHLLYRVYRELGGGDPLSTPPMQAGC